MKKVSLVFVLILFCDVVCSQSLWGLLDGDECMGGYVNRYGILKELPERGMGKDYVPVIQPRTRTIIVTKKKMKYDEWNEKWQDGFCRKICYEIDNTGKIVEVREEVDGNEEVLLSVKDSTIVYEGNKVVKLLNKNPYYYMQRDYKYDSKGFLSKYKKDNKNNYITEITWTSKGCIERRYEHDSYYKHYEERSMTINGNTAVEVCKNENGKITSTHKYKLDSHGNIIVTNYKLFYDYVEYEYDINGNVIWMEMYYEKDKKNKGSHIAYKIEYEYTFYDTPEQIEANCFRNMAEARKNLRQGQFDKSEKQVDSAMIYAKSFTDNNVSSSYTQKVILLKDSIGISRLFEEASKHMLGKQYDDAERLFKQAQELSSTHGIPLKRYEIEANLDSIAIIKAKIELEETLAKRLEKTMANYSFRDEQYASPLSISSKSVLAQKLFEVLCQDFRNGAGMSLSEYDNKFKKMQKEPCLNYVRDNKLQENDIDGLEMLLKIYAEGRKKYINHLYDSLNYYNKYKSISVCLDELLDNLQNYPQKIKENKKNYYN